MGQDIEQLVVGTEYGAPARRMSDCPEGKVTLDMDDLTDRGQVLREHPSRWLIQELMTGANNEIPPTSLIKNLLRVFDSLSKGLFNVDVTSRFQRR
jgi:hypothetical protein